MRILFTIGVAYRSEWRTGLMRSAHETCKALQAGGHHPMVLVDAASMPWGMDLAAEGETASATFGYPVMYGFDNFATLARRFRPNAVVVLNQPYPAMALRAHVVGVPAIVYAHEVPAYAEACAPPLREVCKAAAVSRFAAERLSSAYALDDVAVIPPVVSREQYAVESSRRTALIIAASPDKVAPWMPALVRGCPDIPFVCVGGAALSWAQDYGNLTALPFADDVRPALRETRVILSSSAAETWGRTISEAQVSGIPALALDAGGVSEAVGAGGIVMPAAASVAEWAEALQGLWNDPAAYAGLSSATLAWSNRAEFQAAALVDKLLTLVS